MDLITYLRLLRRHWWMVALAVLVSVVAAVGATQLQQPRYTTSAQLLVNGGSTISAGDEVTNRLLAKQRSSLFAQVAPTAPVVAAAIDAADKADPASQPRASAPAVRATASGDDPFLTVTVTANTAAAAQALANSYVNVLPVQLQQLNQVPSASNALLTVLSPAGLPSKPTSPNLLRNILIALALGVILGLAAALIRESLDTRMRDSDEVRRVTDANILGIIPREFGNEKLPAATRPHSRRSEAYRAVRTNLEFATGEHPPRSVVFTSPGQGEGKSATTANLALLISRAGKRVVIVDADLRKPTVESYFNASREPGLADVLGGHRALDDVLQPIEGENITVLASGPVARNPSELLGSPAMQTVLDGLRASFDLVVVDTPPVLAVTDALLAGVNTDGVVMIARMGSTTRSGLRRALEAVTKVDGTVLGVVVNAAAETEDKRYGYGAGYASQDKSTEGGDIRPVDASRADGLHRRQPTPYRNPAPDRPADVTLHG